MNSDKEVNIDSLWEEFKDKKPLRLGIFVGEENEKYYVAKSEEEVYELSALVYYVWLICDGERTVEQLADQMSKDISIDLDQIIEPLILAINSLNRVQLLRFT